MDSMPPLDRIERLKYFIGLITKFSESPRIYGKDGNTAALDEIRVAINQEKSWVKNQVMQAGCFKVVNISPPPLIGGPLIQNADPFDLLFSNPHGVTITSYVTDMINETIGALANEPNEMDTEPAPDLLESDEIEAGSVFVAMPMAKGDHELDDVLDAIKEAAGRCGLVARRVDDNDNNERITDRVLDHIRSSEHIVVDLSRSKPNVYYEAGFAHALGKLPIYIAKEGTEIEFDIKDYPVVFFGGMRDLKDRLEQRLQGLLGR